MLVLVLGIANWSEVPDIGLFTDRRTAFCMSSKTKYFRL